MTDLMISHIFEEALSVSESVEYPIFIGEARYAFICVVVSGIEVRLESRPRTYRRAGTGQPCPMNPAAGFFVKSNIKKPGDRIAFQRTFCFSSSNSFCRACSEFESGEYPCGSRTASRFHTQIRDQCSRIGAFIRGLQTTTVALANPVNQRSCVVGATRLRSALSTTIARFYAGRVTAFSHGRAMTPSALWRLHPARVRL